MVCIRERSIYWYFNCLGVVYIWGMSSNEDSSSLQDVVWCLWSNGQMVMHWILNPGIHNSKLMGGFNLNSAFHPFEVDKWVPGFSGVLVVERKLSPCCGSVALRQLNLANKKGSKSFNKIVFKFLLFWCIEVWKKKMSHLSLHKETCKAYF